MQLLCGTGKSLIAYFVADRLHANTIAVAVPTLNLVKQTVKVWMTEEAARDRLSPWLCVGSDETVNEEADQIADSAQLREPLSFRAPRFVGHSTKSPCT